MTADANLAEIARLRTALLRANADNAALRKEFHTTLTTIGGRLYTQGTGAKWQMDLLSFVRDERARLEAHLPGNPDAAEQVLSQILGEL